MFNPDAVQRFVDLVVMEDEFNAVLLATQIVDSWPSTENCIFPDAEYNDTEMAEKVQNDLNALVMAPVSVCYSEYIPRIVGHINQYLLARVQYDDDREIGSESSDQSSAEEDSAGS
jgi:hypothetical protein